MNDLGNPAWMEVKKIEDKKLKAIRKSMPELKKLFKFVDANGLIYQKLDPYHNRVKNAKTGKFVDWWNGGQMTMRRIDGTYGPQGKKQGFLYQEITNLI